MKAIPHDDMVKLLKLCWEWRHNPNLVMQFGNVEAEIEFFASLVKADGWLKGYVPASRMDWQNTYKVYAPCMLKKYKHLVALMIDLVKCEIEVGNCGMFVLKYIELLSAEIPLATCTSQNMPFFRLKLAAEILRGDAYMP
ncbi:unnamed protein product [Prunus armeniaca]